MAALTVTEPGVYDAIPEATYHADRLSLSVSGAKKLLPPSCPAKFKWDRDHGQANKRAFDFGHAAHADVLGVGAPLLVVDADSWRTKAAQQQQAEAYARGEVPILAHEHRQVQGMANALRCDPFASSLFDPDNGAAEQSLYWDDPEFGIRRRARADWITTTADGRLVIVDYKTCQSAEPSEIAKAVANFGYDMQREWYWDAAVALGMDEDPAFLFVFQEKSAPYVVTVAELNDTARHRGRVRNRQALEVYAECMATDTWPGYSTDIELISLPGWATYDLEIA